VTNNNPDKIMHRGTSFEAECTTVKELWGNHSNEIVEQRDKWQLGYQHN